MRAAYNAAWLSTPHMCAIMLEGRLCGLVGVVVGMLALQPLPQLLGSSPSEDPLSPRSHLFAFSAGRSLITTSRQLWQGCPKSPAIGRSSRACSRRCSIPSIGRLTGWADHTRALALTRC
jgi:hypothetical protein